MKSLEYVLNTKPKDIEFMPFREALELQKKNGNELYLSLWDKKKVAGKLILLSDEEEARMQECNKALRWVDKKIRELDGEEL